MKKLVLLAVMFALTGVIAQAQTSCPVAQMISPTPGTTLPSGAVTFEWCNASADYFLTVESVPGAHDIFNAVVRVTSVTLGPACATTPPIQCIPDLGEKIFVTLWTQINGQWQSPFQYTYTAPNATPPAPAATTTAVADKSVIFSNASQNVVLSATVSGGTVNQGTVTFQVLNGAANVGSAVTSATLTNGSASAIYVLPAGTIPSTYTIQANYSGGTSFQASSGTAPLTVNPAPPVAAPTTTTPVDQTVVFSSGAQNVTLTANVAAAGAAINEGTITFQVKNGAADVGTAVSSATVSNGSASVIYALPAGLAANNYAIQAAYSGGTNFEASSGTAALVVNPAAPPAQAATATTVGNNVVTFSNDAQNVTLTASVAVPDGVVDQGTITFEVMDGATIIGSAVPSPALVGGSASVSFALPAGTPAKDYTIQAAYSGGSSFQASSGNGTLTINKAESVTNFTSTAPASLSFQGTYTPAATSSGDGSLSLGASGSCSIANGVVTMTSGTGTCTVTATESEGANFLGSSATAQTIAAAKASATVIVNSITVPYDGQPHSASATTTPAGLKVNFTYNGSSTPPTNPGVYQVVAMIDDPNFEGSGNGTLTITTSLAALRDQVAGLNLNAGDKKSLIAKLQAAQAAMDRGNGRAAVNQLRAFINEVQALQRSRRLDASTAASLIAQATFFMGQAGPSQGRESVMGKVGGNDGRASIAAGRRFAR